MRTLLLILFIATAAGCSTMAPKYKRPDAPVAATFQYNLSLAHLQRFEYQPAQEARSQAERFRSHRHDLWYRALLRVGP